MKAIKIYADGKQEIVNVSTLDDFQEAVEGYIEATGRFPSDPNLIGFVNEDGKFQELPVNVKASELVFGEQFKKDYVSGQVYDAVCGTMLVLGYDPETGEEKDIPHDYL